MTHVAAIAPVLCLLFTPFVAHAAPGPDGALHARAPEPPRHAVHADLSTFLVSGGVTLNYERFFGEHFAVRVGYGASGIFWLTGGERAHGPLAAATLLLGGDANFELTAGASFISATGEPPAGAALGDGWFVAPTVFAGYRYQPVGGGLVTRLGVGWTSGWGTMLTFGAGYAF